MTPPLHRFRRIVFLLTGAALAAGVLASPVAAGQSRLSVLRHATAPLHDIAAANAAGYTVQVYDLAGITCIADPNGTGTMGIHFLNPTCWAPSTPRSPSC